MNNLSIETNEFIVKMLKLIQKSVNRIEASNENFNKLRTEELPKIKDDISNIKTSIKKSENKYARKKFICYFKLKCYSC